MRQRVNIEKRGSDWVVFLGSKRVVYSSTDYAKAVGVFEYLEARVAEQEAEIRRGQIEFKNAALAKAEGRS